MENLDPMQLCEVTFDQPDDYLITYQDSNEVKEDKNVIPKRNCVSLERNYVSPERKYASPERKYVFPETNCVSPERNCISPEGNYVSPEKKTREKNFKFRICTKTFVDDWKLKRHEKPT